MFNKIRNPETGKWVDVNGNVGRKVLNNYSNQLGGSWGLPPPPSPACAGADPCPPCPPCPPAPCPPPSLPAPLSGRTACLENYRTDLGDYSLYQRFCEIEKGNNTRGFLYRALRPDELETWVRTNSLLSACNPCPGQTCCDKSPNAHITAGSRAKTKSAWISTTMEPGIAALWSSRRKQPGDKSLIKLDGNSSSGIFVVIDPAPPGLPPLELVGDSELEKYGVIGVTGKNAASASQEILIKYTIPSNYILGFLEAEQVTKSVWNEWKGGKTSGKRKSKGSKIYVIWRRLSPASKEAMGYLRIAAARGLKSRFRSGMSMSPRRSRSRSRSRSRDRATAMKSRSRSRSRDRGGGAGAALSRSRSRSRDRISRS